MIEKPPFERCLITGGAGFIGSHLAEALLAQGRRVTVIDNLSTGRYQNIQHLTTAPQFRFVTGDIGDESVLGPLVQESDVVFHLAAAVGVELIVKDPVRVIETNILGTHAVLKAAGRYGTKVLLASTSEIYGKSTDMPFREDGDRLLGPTTKARWSYSDSKAVDEFLALAYHSQTGLPVVILRLFNTIGPRQTGQYGMVVPRFVEQAMAGRPLTVYGDGQQSRCFCDVSDCVRAIVGLTECLPAVGEVFNIGSNVEVSILELAKKVLALVDQVRGQGATTRRDGAHRAPETPRGAANPRILLVPYDEAYAPGFEDMQRRVPDIARVRGLIGWTPQIPLEETLRSVIAFQMKERATHGLAHQA